MYQVKKSGKNNILFEHYPPEKMIPLNPGVISTAFSSSE
jgi:hypothetical protein